MTTSPVSNDAKEKYKHYLLDYPLEPKSPQTPEEVRTQQESEPYEVTKTEPS